MPNLRTQTGYDIVLDNKVRTAVETPSSQFANGATGIRLDINIAAITGTSITFTVQGYNPANGTWSTLLASAAKTATGDTVLQIDPRQAAATNLTAQAIVPDRFRLLVTHTGITTATYSAVLTRSY